jgi:AhpC/TSA family
MKRRSFLSLGLNMIAGVGALPHAQAAVPPVAAKLGQSAPAFEVADAAGRQRALSEFSGRIAVLEWSSPSCPFAAAQYASGRMPELQRWAKGKGVVWLTLLSSHPSRSDYLPGAQADALNRKRGGVPSALLIDANGTVGRAFGAATANHMFVIASNGLLVHAGGIDDSSSMKPKEVAVSHNFVRAALQDLTTGRSVSISSTEPVGCNLAYAG